MVERLSRLPHQARRLEGGFSPTANDRFYRLPEFCLPYRPGWRRALPTARPGAASGSMHGDDDGRADRRINYARRIRSAGKDSMDMKAPSIIHCFKNNADADVIGPMRGLKAPVAEKIGRRCKKDIGAAFLGGIQIGDRIGAERTWSCGGLLPSRKGRIA